MTIFRLNRMLIIKCGIKEGKGIFYPASNMMVMEQNDEIRKKAERFESQYERLKQEFRDYIEANRRNEEIKRQGVKTEGAKKLLVVADSLSRISAANNHRPCDTVKSYSENLKKNIDVIYGQLLSVTGLVPIEPLSGDKFDDNMHMAIGLEYSTAYPENSVYRVIRKGYRIENNVVRPAEVIVSKRSVEAIKVTQPGFWDSVLKWIRPTKQRFAALDQRMDELTRVHEEKLGELTLGISSMKSIITQLKARDNKVDELEHVYEGEMEKVRQEMAALKNKIMEFEEKMGSKEQAPLQKSETGAVSEE